MGERAPTFKRDEILRARGARNELEISSPYHSFVEQERNDAGETVDVAVLLLTNRECPFTCLMCDLWKNTLTTSVPVKAIPEQIRFGLERLPDCDSIKLYNSGSFFDPKAIPPEDYDAIAELVRPFQKVVVENHPRFCTEACLAFRDLIYPAQLEVAIGLETCDETVLAQLNKQMTLDDFSTSVARLKKWGIQSRAFILLKPPFHDENDAIEWTLKSITFAFEAGVNSCSVIPTRSGNGIMERLQKEGLFSPPKGSSIEVVMDEAMNSQHPGNLVVDLWDAQRFFSCSSCRNDRIERLRRINLQQRSLEPINCLDCKEY